MKGIKYNSKIISFFKNQNIQVVLLTIVGLFGLLFWVIPISELFAEKILNNKLVSSLSCLCGIVLTLILIISIFKNGKKDKKYYIDLLCVSPIVFLEVISILMLFKNTLWGYKTFVLAAAFSWLLIVGIIIGIATLFNKVFNREMVPVILIALFVAILVFSFACANVGGKEYSEFFYKASGAIIYLIAIALYAYKYIYSPKYENKIITNIIGIVFWGSFIIISFPYYVQWCGLNGNNLATFVSIYAAVTGGALTLAGVAWTINDANNKRNDDIKRIEEQRKKDIERIENDRKEEERRKYRPIVHVFAGPYSGMKTDINVFSWLNDTDKISKTATETLTVASRIHSCYFGNTDFSNAYVWGIKINGHMTHFSSIRYIKKEHYFYLDFSDKPIYTEKPIETISLILEDVLENLYELPLEHTFSDSFKWYIIQGNNPSIYIGKVNKEDNYEQHIDREGISAIHNQSTDKKKWLY